jgi:hypothetical protein
MEIPLSQAQGIMIYLNRRRAIFVTGITMLIFALFLSMSVFTIWAFWNHYHIDSGAYAAAILLAIFTPAMGAAIVIYLRRGYQRAPVIIVDAQGIHLNSQLVGGQHFLPWSHIECISSFRMNLYTSLAILLKNPTLYRGDVSYERRRDPMTGAHFTILQTLLSLPAAQIMRQIEETYASELLRYKVKILS